ncbi:unnamed protein product [Paramecium primaurelia]|uniref:Uncharacterized protein n=1 Tax=Paramecium primaurelia TaxID=5886 RepID=A0A8S1K6D2_PARPR|nr:unnamed protein product [Paramecium primaurelia]
MIFKDKIRQKYKKEINLLKKKEQKTKINKKDELKLRLMEG